MVLSRVALDAANRQTMIALQNPAKFHGAVEQAFEPRAKRVLWRVDTLGGRYYLLILSEETPTLDGVVRQFGTGEAPETRDYAPLLERISDGSRWAFRLHANPTYSQGGDGKRGKVHACTVIRPPREATAEVKTQYGWLMHQAQAHGFALDEDGFGVTRNQWFSFSKPGSGQVRLLGVTYEGMLTVTDAQKFRQALTEGVGRGKAYGMGLLTVVRP